MIQCMALERGPFGLGISRVHERFERYAMHAKGPSVYGIQLRYWQKDTTFWKMFDSVPFSEHMHSKLSKSTNMTTENFSTNSIMGYKKHKILCQFKLFPYVLKKMFRTKAISKVHWRNVQNPTNSNFAKYFAYYFLSKHFKAHFNEFGQNKIQRFFKPPYGL